MKLSSAYATLVGAGAVATALICWLGSGYIFELGFPLDDAWIHSVYGRSLATEGHLAYNPGEPATGATSPLWAVVLAVAHLLGQTTREIVLWSKALGWGLHLASALLFFAAVNFDEERRLLAILGGLFVLLHPDLIAASISGMEVPLATAVVGLIAFATFRHRLILLAVGAALASVARPEIAVLAFMLPMLCWLGHSRNKLIHQLVAVTVGSALSWGLLALRNLSVSGRPLPATFYVKAGSGSPGPIEALVQGYSSLLGQFPLVDSSVLLLVGIASATWYLFKRGENTLSSRAIASSFLGGVAFFAVSFVLVYPGDTVAFYHQRYPLPGLPLVLAAFPLLIWHLVAELFPADRPFGKSAAAAIVVLTAASYGLDLSERLNRLSNDARNIDDVQVALGTSLEEVSSEHVIWLTDAGAIRYFGNAYAVDLMGLNTDPLLGAQRKAYLESHRPNFLHVMPAWTTLDEESEESFPRQVFEPNTPYSVTGNRAMRVQMLYECTPAGSPGWIRVFDEGHTFECASEGSHEQ